MFRRMHIADANQKLYVCPGDTVPISHAVHLGRLARLYPPCETCPLNHESGRSARSVSDRLTRKHERRLAETHHEPGRIRGVYLNQITRSVAADLAAQVARQLWQEVDRRARTHRREHVETWSAPTVVIGYDRRPSSPDIVTGVQNQLRLMGCNVIDIGIASTPLVRYASRFHRAAGAIHVTGSGQSLAWTGLDVYDSAGGPLKSDSLSLESRSMGPDGTSRPVRSAGNYSFRPMAALYARRLHRFLRPSRAVNVVVGAEDEWTQDFVREALQPMSGELSVIALPKRLRNLDDPEDADVRRVGQQTLETAADFGFVIDEDLERCALVDNTGELAYDHETAAILSRSLFPSERSVTGCDSGPQRIEAIENVFRFPQQSISCDAVLTLARLITALSRETDPVAALIAGNLDRRAA